MAEPYVISDTRFRMVSLTTCSVLSARDGGIMPVVCPAGG